MKARLGTNDESYQLSGESEYRRSPIADRRQAEVRQLRALIFQVHWAFDYQL
jgi:hypothetical protein